MGERRPSEGEIEAALAAIVEASDQPLGVTRDGVVRLVNPALAALLGYDDPSEVTGREMVRFIAPSSLEAIAATIQRIDAGDPPPATVTTRVVKKDGSEAVLQANLVDYRADGHTYLFARVGELGEPDDAAAASRESGAFYRAIFEVNTAVKLLISPRTGRIVDANQPAVDFYGWPIETLRQMKITDINMLTPEEVAAEMENARTLRRRYFRFRHRTARGDVRHVEVYSGPVEIEGEQLLFSIVHDVTERDELEEQLRKSHRLESIGRLAGGVAHDFNNLLTVMLTSVDFLERKLPKGSPLGPNIEDLRHAARRAAELTNALLAFGRQQLLQPRTLYVNGLIERMGRILERTVGPSIELVLELDPDDPAVCADASQIEQVIMNLALNARDAMPEGGTLTIRSGSVDIEEDGGAVPPGRWVRLTVTDTGQGMDETTAAQVFEPFFTTKAPGAGTGLGLASVYGIVGQSDGHIRVHSRPGAGSTFEISLPPAPDAAACEDKWAEAARRGRPGGEPVTAGGRHTVLLVDDVVGVRDVLRSALEEAGYRVIAAASFEEAQALPPGQLAEVDALVTDVVMPGRSGVELATEMLGANPALRVVLISGHMRDEDISALPEHVSFMQKPFDGDELVRELGRLLGSE